MYFCLLCNNLLHSDHDTNSWASSNFKAMTPVFLPCGHNGLMVEFVNKILWYYPLNETFSAMYDFFQYFTKWQIHKHILHYLQLILTMSTVCFTTYNKLRKKTHSHSTLIWSSQNMINSKLGVGAPHLCKQMTVKMMMAETNIQALRRNEETTRTNTHLRLAGTFDRWHKVALISSASGWANVLAQGKYIKPRFFNGWTVLFTG